MCMCLNSSARFTFVFLGQKMFKFLFIYFLFIYLLIYLSYFICELLKLTELKAKVQATYAGTERWGKVNNNFPSCYYNLRIFLKRIATSNTSSSS
jgi:hypothetical protein